MISAHLRGRIYFIYLLNSKLSRQGTWPANRFSDEQFFWEKSYMVWRTSFPFLIYQLAAINRNQL